MISIGGGGSKGGSSSLLKGRVRGKEEGPP